MARIKTLKDVKEELKEIGFCNVIYDEHLYCIGKMSDNRYEITDTVEPDDFSTEYHLTLEKAYDSLIERYNNMKKKKETNSSETEQTTVAENIEIKKNDGTGMWHKWIGGKLIEVYTTEKAARDSIK